MYYLSYVRCLENDNLIIFCSTPEWYSGSVLDESLIRLMIDDELNIYSDYYEYKVDGNCCQQETLNLVVIKIYGVLKIQYEIWVSGKYKRSCGIGY